MSPKKRRARASRWFLRILFPAAALLVLLGISNYYQDTWDSPWDRDPGWDSQAPETTPAERLQEAVILGARELGVPQSRIARRPGSAGRPRFEFRCPDRLHPIGANRWLSRIFRDAEIRIRDCWEEGSPARPKLVYSLAAGRGQDAAEAELVLYPPMGEAPLREAWPRLAILIDDLGYNFSRTTRGMLELDLPVTASILPKLRYSRRIEQEARRRGHAVFLHLPMEPRNYPVVDPGPGALFAGTSADSLRVQIQELAEGFERLDGFNNHMGSRACCDESVVRPVLDWAERESLLVVDSMTDAASRIYPLARARDLPALRADLFLDGAHETQAQIMGKLADAAETARKRGWAMVICHPRSETLKALRGMTPRLKDYGLRFVTVPQLVASLAESDPASPLARRGEH